MTRVAQLSLSDDDEPRAIAHPVANEISGRRAVAIALNEPRTDPDLDSTPRSMQPLGGVTDPRLRDDDQELIQIGFCAALRKGWRAGWGIQQINQTPAVAVDREGNAACGPEGIGPDRRGDDINTRVLTLLSP